MRRNLLRFTISVHRLKPKWSTICCDKMAFVRPFSLATTLFRRCSRLCAPGAVVLVDERDLDRAQEIYSLFFGKDITPLTGGTLEEDDE